MISPEAPREWWIEFKGTAYAVLVDDDDRAFLERFSWHLKPDKKTFYLYTNVKIGGRTTSISMHRLICGLVSSEIDHINRNGLDNRKSNLRFSTSKENQRNRVRFNSHGYRGVYKSGNQYSVQIQVNGKKKRAYGFKTPEEAARKYDEMCKEFHGEFGIKNFKD